VNKTPRTARTLPSPAFPQGFGGSKNKGEGKFMSKINEIITVLANIVTIIGYINWACIKNLFKKILKSIIGSIIKSFNWLLVKYFKIIWKIIGMEKRFEEENDRLEKELQDKIKELAEAQTHGFYRFLKRKFPSCSNVYMEVNIKSKTFKKTKNRYEEYESKYCHITDSFDKKQFKIAISNFTLDIPYSKLEEWDDDEQPDSDKKIDLYLNRAVVLYENEKLELEAFNKIWCCCCLGKGRLP
jgi:hypothetical protein